MVEIGNNGESSLVLDDEFTKFLPPLSEEERGRLAEDIKAHGCLSPLVIWENGDGHKYLLDGYHRYEICQEYQIPFQLKVVDGLATRSDAMGWMLQHQFGRRNLTPTQRLRIASEFREMLEREAAERKKKGNSKKKDDESPDEDVAIKEKGEVNERIGALAGVSREQVRKFRLIEKHATPEELADLDDGKIKISTLYNKYCAKPAQEVEVKEETVEPESVVVNAATVETVAPEDNFEMVVASFPLSTKLSGHQLEIFKKDAQDYLYFADYRKKIGDVARVRFKKGGGKGPWAHALIRFLKCEHPKDWLICPEPENGGCSGTGVYEFGECPRCHGAGYWIKGTYVLSTKA